MVLPLVNENESVSTLVEVHANDVIEVCGYGSQGLHCQLIRDPVKLTSPTQHASR